ncbi:MAG: HAMP domain-containing sensor histidine kinase [Clostridiales bacterium]|nr:HAMP domain-containing sensor histidine kinase [Clostridiales bacterium]
MRFFSRYTVKLSVCAFFSAAAIILLSSVLAPALLKSALLKSKSQYMQETAAVFSHTLESDGFDAVSEYAAANKNGSGLRFIVTDGSLCVVADTSDAANLCGQKLLLPGTREVLDGGTRFDAAFENGEFIYSALSSFEKDGERCILFVRFTDYETAALFSKCRKALFFSGLALGLPPLGFTVFFLANFGIRLGKHSDSVELLTLGKYVSSDDIRGHDEISNAARLLDDFAKRQEKTEELRKRFVSDASHELKTPLATVKLLSDSILLTPNISSEDAHEFLTDISTEIDRLTRICTKLLQITKFDTLSGESEFVRVELSPIIENVCRMLSRPALSAGLELRQELQDGCFVLANYDTMYQIFYNLIENAVKYGADGKEIRIYLYLKGKSVIFIVDDDGLGIPEAELARIFDRFYRVDKARARATGGTGLGLSIVATAVKNCHGTIEAQNRAPHGARFIVRFPFCPPDPEPISDEGGRQQ